MNYKPLDRAAVTGLLDITIPTLDKMRKQGGFAKHIVIGDRSIRWRDRDVQAWIDQKLADAEAE